MGATPMLSRRWVLIALFLCVSALRAERAMGDVRIYDDDPQHLWNRMHETLFVRLGPDGVRYGEDRIDPLLWPSSKHLLERPSQQRALQILDEFRSKGGERLVRDPFKRALLQHDLWIVFDWAARPTIRSDAPYSAERSELRMRLAPIIRDLALSTEEITALPDNYSRTIAKRGAELLPPGLFDEGGEWIRIGAPNGVAPSHMRFVGSRSSFHVLMRVPGGRAKGLEYLDRLAKFEEPWVVEEPPVAPGYFRSRASRALPQFPPQTQWALVRRMRVLDREGTIRVTPIIQSIQLRRYLVVPERDGDQFDRENAQSMHVFQMSRARGGDLIEVEKGAREFFQFHAHDIDPFDVSAEKLARRSLEPSSFRTRLQYEVPRFCQTCHNDRGILSVNSLIWPIAADRPWPILFVLKTDATIGSQAYSSTHEYGVLRGMWER